MSTAISTVPENKSVVICNLVLAPSSKPDDPNTNSNVKFQIAVEPMEYGAVSNALRIMCEDSCSNCFLPFIANRSLEETTPSYVAVEFVYGNGFKTFMKRADALEIKAFKQLAVNMSIGSPNAQNIDNMPIVLPEDDLYFHVASYASSTGLKPTIYIRTGGPLFLFPEDKSNASKIELVVPGKRGYWTGANFLGKREVYPDVLPVKPVFTRKRKKREGKEDDGEKPTVKKGKKDDDSDKDSEEEADEKPSTTFEKKESEDEEEEKPKKKPVTKKKPETPVKQAESEDDDDTDDDKASKKKEESAKKKSKPVAKKSHPKKAHKDGAKPEDGEKKDDKKAASRRKSKGTTPKPPKKQSTA